MLGAGFIDPRDCSICVISSSFLDDLVDVFVDLEVGTGGGSFGPRYLKKQGRSSGSVLGAIVCISSSAATTGFFNFSALGVPFSDLGTRLLSSRGAWDGPPSTPRRAESEPAVE